MECPICGGYLIDEGPYGFLARHQSGEVLGRIYRCSNHDGFKTPEDAESFLVRTGQSLEDMGIESLEEVTCDSSMHSVSGSFYTDKHENLHEGYPC